MSDKVFFHVPVDRPDMPSQQYHHWDSGLILPEALQHVLHALVRPSQARELVRGGVSPTLAPIVGDNPPGMTDSQTQNKRRQALANSPRQPLNQGWVEQLLQGQVSPRAGSNGAAPIRSPAQQSTRPIRVQQSSPMEPGRSAVKPRNKYHEVSFDAGMSALAGAQPEAEAPVRLGAITSVLLPGLEAAYA